MRQLRPKLGTVIVTYEQVADKQKSEEERLVVDVKV